MTIVGVTGGIASGKSTVTKMFADRGARTYSADDDARAVLQDDAVRAAVFAVFPESRNPDGTLNRAALGSRIFADPSARKQLESILHPPIRVRMRGTVAAARGNSDPGVLAYEVPLLYEGGHETLFDCVIVALATPELQAERLQERERQGNRPLLSDAAIADRLSAQLPPEEKARRADYVIRTDVTIAETRRQIEAIWRELTEAP